jgi:hypothetical protein
VRLLAILALALIPAPALADAATERAIALVKELCLDPAAPADQMAAAERTAAAAGWRLDAKSSGRRHGVIASPDDLRRPEMFDSRRWVLSGSELNGEFQITIVTPEWKGWRQNTCGIFSTQLRVDDLVAAAKGRLGLGEPQTSADFGATWVVSDGLGPAKLGQSKRIVAAQRQRLQSGEVTSFGTVEFRVPADRAMPKPVAGRKPSPM